MRNTDTMVQVIPKGCCAIRLDNHVSTIRSIDWICHHYKLSSLHSWNMICLHSTVRLMPGSCLYTSTQLIYNNQIKSPVSSGVMLVPLNPVCCLLVSENSLPRGMMDGASWFLQCNGQVETFFCEGMVKWKLIVSFQDGLAAISIYCTIYCFRVQLKKIYCFRVGEQLLQKWTHLHKFCLPFSGFCADNVWFLLMVRGPDVSFQGTRHKFS
jgi:hypothetical protein